MIFTMSESKKSGHHFNQYHVAIVVKPNGAHSIYLIACVQFTLIYMLDKISGGLSNAYYHYYHSLKSIDVISRWSRHSTLYLQ